MPKCLIHGFHFHFCKCLLKQIRKLGPSYNDDDSLRGLLHSVYALPFVPTDDITLGWNALSTELATRYPRVAHTFLPYFESTWMTGNYPMDMWNCYVRTPDNFPRTNNISEGSNNVITSIYTIWIWWLVTGVNSHPSHGLDRSHAQSSKMVIFAELNRI